MESSSLAGGYENRCKSLIVTDFPLQKFPADLYGLLILTAILNAISCPFTILLNTLVILAVKTKRRLQNPANVLLACLAVTDVIVGLVSQPLYLTITVFLLRGKSFVDFCDIDAVFSICLAITGSASMHHLALVSGERYFAIKHSFTHHNSVNNARLVIASTLAWLAAFVLIGVAPYAKAAQAFPPAVILSIVVFQVLVYQVARRHERQILAQQVSSEARARFEREKKALKITARILVAIFGCYTPSMILFVARRIYGDKISADFQTSYRHLMFLPVILNSLINPVIYTMQNPQFRIAIIEIVWRKSYQEAEALERSLFAPKNNAVVPQTIQQADGQHYQA